MLNEVMDMFAQADIENPSHNYLDGTFGRGGHARALIDRFPELSLYALDKDKEAIEHGKEQFAQRAKNKKFFIEQASFASLDKVIEDKHWPAKYDMILLDLGVSSPQLDQGSRGFSFYHQGPLDMRMDQRAPLTAEEIINYWSEEELVDIFRDYGEVFRPYNVVKSIIRERKKGSISSTSDLSGLIERSVGWKKKGKHPATQYFMALRLVVNRELEDLKEGLQALMKRLVPGGRLVVITFHSLEDRIVKQVFKTSEYGKPVNKKVIKPTREEELENKRSRSAKLRAFERIIEQSLKQEFDKRHGGRHE
ncbi:MAG: 16S rRNA (cytosine(1402)-N(4))-methyltransferase RsmH [Bdellovibrionales bacterium]|nr:16S rRNA (cytosine(1402)-N(4))-methyltransferase RsmH [Bdellovibrionales bacterium]